MDAKLKAARLDGYQVDGDNQKIYNLAGNYVKRFDEMYEKRQGLLFWGTVGTGKSYTAACIANELLNQMIPVVMTSFVKILQNIQGNPDEEERIMAGTNTAKLLIIDDLGAERSTDYALEKVYNIIDSRYLCVATMVVQIPIPLGYAHLGDSVILISAYFFGPVVGALAGGIGSAMADILTGYAIWALPTLLIKTIMPVIACTFFKNNVQRCKVFSIRGIAGAVVTLLFMTAGYVFFGGILYGSAAAGIASAPGLLLKSVVNLAVYLFVAFGISKVKKFN